MNTVIYTEFGYICVSPAGHPMKDGLGKVLVLTEAIAKSYEKNDPFWTAKKVKIDFINI